MSEKVKLKGHESFSIREGWITKGLIEVKNNGKLFSKKDVTDILGIGTNMVKSLKYWLITANLIEEEKKCFYRLTELGELIYKFDPYIEDIFTIYMIHIQICTNTNKALIWSIFYNYCNMKEFSKRDLIEQIEYYLNINNYEYNEKMLIDEINILLKTYTNEEKEDNPENNFICPLTELNLIKKVKKDLYYRNSADMDKLNMYIVYYLICKQAGKEISINIDEILKGKNSAGKLLNISKSELNLYLDMLKREKCITINKTAGLNMVYIHKKYELNKIFDLYFGEEI